MERERRLVPEIFSDFINHGASFIAIHGYGGRNTPSSDAFVTVVMAKLHVLIINPRGIAADEEKCIESLDGRMLKKCSFHPKTYPCARRLKDRSKLPPTKERKKDEGRGKYRGIFPPLLSIRVCHFFLLSFLECLGGFAISPVLGPAGGIMGVSPFGRASDPQIKIRK